MIYLPTKYSRRGSVPIFSAKKWEQILIIFLFFWLVLWGLSWAGDPLSGEGLSSEPFVCGQNFCLGEEDLAAIRQEIAQSPYRPTTKALQEYALQRMLFSLEAERLGLVDFCPADWRERMQAAMLYERHLLSSWQPSRKAVLSFARANARRFGGCKAVEDLSPKSAIYQAIVKKLRRIARRKIIYQAEEKLKVRYQVKWYED